MDLGVPLGRSLGSQASSCVEKCKSTLLLSRKSSVRLPILLTIGIGGFLLMFHRAVTPAIVFESELVVTVESVQGSQVCLDCTRTSGAFEMVARPLEFLSSIKWIPPPLEVRRQCRDSLPYEAGKRTLLSG